MSQYHTGLRDRRGIWVHQVHNPVQLLFITLHDKHSWSARETIEWQIYVMEILGWKLLRFDGWDSSDQTETFAFYLVTLASP